MDTLHCLDSECDILTLKDGRCVIPLRRLSSGKILCRMERRFDGVTDTSWIVVSPQDIQNAQGTVPEWLVGCPTIKKSRNAMHDLGVL